MRIIIHHHVLKEVSSTSYVRRNVMCPKRSHPVAKHETVEELDALGESVALYLVSVPRRRSPLRREQRIAGYAESTAAAASHLKGRPSRSEFQSLRGVVAVAVTVVNSGSQH